MLKLEQILLVDTELIVKGFEPEVHIKVGDIMKSDDVIQKDKDNSPFILAEIVSVGKPIPEQPANPNPPTYFVGQIVLIGRNVGTHLTMPIEGYKEKELAIISAYAVTAVINIDNSIPAIEITL